MRDKKFVIKHVLFISLSDMLTDVYRAATMVMDATVLL